MPVDSNERGDGDGDERIPVAIALTTVIHHRKTENRIVGLACS